MTRQEAERIIKAYRNEKYYSISCLQVGEVEIVEVFENGFTFKRKTEYVETFGIYNVYEFGYNIYDVNTYNIAEVITKRIK